MPTPVVTIAALADAAEGGSAGGFRLTRDDTSGTITVDVSIGGTATPTSDHFLMSTWAVIFGPGEATADLNVSAFDDGTSEPTETVVCTLVAGSGYSVGSSSSATIDILDNDAQEVTVSRVNDAVEDGTDGVFLFTRIGDLSSALTVNISVGGTATSGTDYTALTSTVVFAANSATATKTVIAERDGLDDEGNETVSVTVTTGSGYGVGSPASAELSVIDTDILPVAFDGWATVSINDEVEVDVLDLVSNLYEDELTVTAVTQGENGAVVDNEDGTVTYTPDADFSGEDTFTYTVEDPFGNEAIGTITVSVTRPLAPPTSVWTAEDTAVNVEVLEMAFDPDGDELTTVAVTQGDHGTVTIETDGSVTYTPDTSYEGDDSFTYTVEDPDGNEATNTITVTVGATDPIALDDETATPVNTAVEVDVFDLSYQPQGGSLTVTSITQGSHGTVVDNEDGTVTYTPGSSYTGTDTFTYTVTDAFSNTATGTITVVVGTPVPTDADDIAEDLDDIADLIAGYTSGSASAIAAAVAGVSPTIVSYVDDVTTFISTNNINTLSGLSYKNFAKQGFNILRDLYPRYTGFLDTLAAVKAVALANKDLIESLNAAQTADKNQAQPNKIVMALRKTAIENLNQIQGALIEAYDNLHKRTEQAKLAADLAYRIMLGRLTVELPEETVTIFAPPPMPAKATGDLFPR